MHKSFYLLFVGLIICTSLWSQSNEENLLSVNNTPVSVAEFKKVYLKNIDLVKDESQKDIDEYLNLFINYKLKIEEAKALGFDKKPTYQKELEGYKKQLASGYLTDTKATEELVKEAYERTLKRVNASHILIRLASDATPQDTLEAYNRIAMIRDKIVTEKKDFNTLAKQYSEDPSAKQNGGNLGWFSAFSMVYDFENAAFTTKVGEVSAPFRTQFGYHILKVNAKEDKQGEVSVAHIMIADENGTKKEEALAQIQKIEAQLKNGAPFDTLAKEFSDDKNTAKNGGRINRFAKGELNSEIFENAAFALQEPGEISAPVKTQYGWHIIKLLQKHPIETFEALKPELTKKVTRDVRSKKITESFINSLKEKYNIQEDQSVVAYFVSELEIGKSLEALLANEKEMNQPLFNIKDTTISYGDFAEYIKPRQVRLTKAKDKDNFITSLYDNFFSSTLLTYYKDNLERDNQEFASVLKEYKEGLLLFDLMEFKVWGAAKEDTTALQNYYKANPSKYTKPITYSVVKASSNNRAKIDALVIALNADKQFEELKSSFSDNKNESVLISKVELEEEDASLAHLKTKKKGVYDISTDDGYHTLVYIENIIPERVQPFDKVKGAVINDYQEYIEGQWLQELRDKYTVEVNKKVLKGVKKELNQ
ncbi:peptidylprolyl isomerase [Aquimarina brevivitae]|uniref:Peptidyl-prolyl cis-trans isomerase SurA n=1 Tax=Aquimarina brevivitae TaxID=323412 RepID=A0A4Q7P0K8_9FLAO|nr:peptidylprolyl isomerase [Aquimarina brevivitae]RZS93194.1 peptidyl-prolyl cis-trans isomerase SurA [Aquimarina brevivitae]